jgi:hypothetical protein
MGEFEKSSKRFAPLAAAFCIMARCFISTLQSQLEDVGSELSQLTQKPSTWGDLYIFGDTVMVLPLMLFQEQAPEL